MVIWLHGHLMSHGQKIQLCQGSGAAFQMVFSFLLQKESLVLEL